MKAAESLIGLGQIGHVGDIEICGNRLLEQCNHMAIKHFYSSAEAVWSNFLSYFNSNLADMKMSG